jgi:hypothetical protein
MRRPLGNTRASSSRRQFFSLHNPRIALFPSFPERGTCRDGEDNQQWKISHNVYYVKLRKWLLWDYSPRGGQKLGLDRSMPCLRATCYFVVEFCVRGVPASAGRGRRAVPPGRFPASVCIVRNRHRCRRSRSCRRPGSRCRPCTSCR